MTWMLLPGPTVLAEVPLSLLILAVAVAISVPVVMLLVATMIAAATYRMGERAAPAAAQRIISGLEGQCASKDQTIAKVVALNAAQAAELGAARGAVAHLQVVAALPTEAERARRRAV